MSDETKINFNDLDSMTPREQEIAIYWRDKNLEHNVSSPETIEKFVNLERKFDNYITCNNEEHDGIRIDMSEIKKLLEEMKPTYKELNDWGTFFQKGKKLGLGLAAFITIIGVIYGGILAFKTWLKY